MASDENSIKKKISELADLMEQKSLIELELETKTRTGTEEKIRILRSGGQTSTTLPPAKEAEPTETLGSSDSNYDSHKGAVRSPIVGTAYLSVQPGAEPFVKLGDKVKEGQVLLIVEAMKVMNSITAHCSGVLKYFPINDGDPVEFGQILAVIE